MVSATSLRVVGHFRPGVNLSVMDRLWAISGKTMGSEATVTNDESLIEMSIEKLLTKLLICPLEL